MFGKALAAIAALSLVASPALAQTGAPRTAAPAAGLPQPAAETVEGSELRRGYLLPLLGLTAAILAILALTHTWPFDNNDDDAVPTSP
jgi:hypothetical protein